MVRLAKEAFSELKPDTMHSLPIGLMLTKRADAPLHIFLGGHLDTVFPSDHPFQTATRVDKDRMRGPGVADMKGGVLVMLQALLAFEELEESKKVGWEIFLNLDEEIGSPHSTAHLKECSKRCDVALLFEPALPNGSFVSARKGSTNFHVVSEGKAAHAGRTPHEGRSAIYPLARFIVSLESLNTLETHVNVGAIRGGRAHNIIPDHAEAAVNVRSFEDLDHELYERAKQVGVSLTKITARPPKPFDAQTEKLFALLKQCGQKLGLNVKWQETGGVCDGNTFGAAGVPTIDTLGVEGGEIHTDEEFIYLPSIDAKARLTTLLLSELTRRDEWKMK